MSENWTPQTWRSKPIKQVPIYSDRQKVNFVRNRLSQYPPLVFPDEVYTLKKKLANVARGEAFLLQGGDCAESFSEHGVDIICAFFRTFLQMSLALTFGAAKPVVRIGRIAGQFAKPRSSDTEERDGIVLPTYRGDIVNSMDFDAIARVPEPERMTMVYHQSSATLNILRAFERSNYTVLENLRTEMPEFVTKSQQGGDYKAFAQHLFFTMDFMRGIGLGSSLQDSALFTSHEALLLEYEEPLTRQDAEKEWYAASGHMLWIGDRTRQLDHAHVEYCRGIRNPLGLKCGPSLQSDELLRLIDILNPANEFGRLTLIVRFGSEKIGKYLPKLIRAVEREGYCVIWLCDPMHGNTTIMNGYKTRSFKNIAEEIKSFFSIHYAEGTYPGGIHLEMTGNDVTECTGGACSISAEDLPKRYLSHCDPRLNASQALELSFLIGDFLWKKQESQTMKTAVNSY